MGSGGAVNLLGFFQRYRQFITMPTALAYTDYTGHGSLQFNPTDGYLANCVPGGHGYTACRTGGHKDLNSGSQLVVRYLTAGGLAAPAMRLSIHSSQWVHTNPGVMLNEAIRVPHDRPAGQFAR
jgi:hypothetical protein